MKEILWKLKFAYEYKRIFSKPAHTFKARFWSGYSTAGKVYEKRKHQTPQQAALDEITDWYCD